jgi:beta-aspartyl-peptidase (threonine type)
VHGGAATISKGVSEARRRRYARALAEAVAIGRDLLAKGEPSLEAVEQVVRWLEDAPLFNAGRGAVCTAEGTHELDAAIMDGRELACGAVAAVRTVKNPVSLARLVMERTGDVLLVGEGADRFAAEAGVDLVDQDYFRTRRRRKQWEKKRGRQQGRSEGGSTVGAVARDVRGHLAAATSTGGLSNKRYGRVGDTPVIGAGTWADDATCAVSCTGRGEEFIRHGVAREVAARIRLLGESLEEAVRALVDRTLAPGDGGLIAVSRAGSVSLAFNTTGMYRGAADSSGRFEVAIWKKRERLEDR